MLFFTYHVVWYMFIKHILIFYQNIIRWDYRSFKCSVSIYNKNYSFFLYFIQCKHHLISNFV